MLTRNLNPDPIWQMWAALSVRVSISTLHYGLLEPGTLPQAASGRAPNRPHPTMMLSWPCPIWCPPAASAKTREETQRKRVEAAPAHLKGRVERDKTLPAVETEDEGSRNRAGFK